jgi:hypothetical protein
LAQSSGHLGPDSVDVIVESLEGEDLELRLLIGEEGQDARRRDQARHGRVSSTRDLRGATDSGGEGALLWPVVSVDW